MSNIDIIIFDEEELTGTLVENYLQELTFPCNLQAYKEFDGEVLKTAETHKIVLVNINLNDTDIFNKIADFRNDKSVKIIAVSYDSSANLQVKAFRAGAKDFLVKPIIKADFINAAQSIYKKYIYKSGEHKKSCVYTAVSNRKGDGKSSFLLNLAKEIADFSKENVLLIDFNNSQDDISVLLNANILHNTNYYIDNLTEDNAQALLSTVTKYKDSTLYVMANSFIKNKLPAITKERLRTSIDILKNHFKYIFIDKTQEKSSIDEETLINVSDEIFCIILPFISSTSKIKEVLNNYCKNKNAKIILNQYTAEDDAIIEQIQTILGGEIFWRIPKNYAAINSALNNNVTLKEAAEGTDIVRAYTELAKYIVKRD